MPLKQKRKEELEAALTRPDFWSDKEKAQKQSQELQNLNQEIEPLLAIRNELEDLEELVNILNSDKIKDEKLHEEVIEKYKEITEKLGKLKHKSESADKYDSAGAILMISAGAGGVDAQDWAEMLLRMYLRFLEAKGFKAEVIAVSSGGEAGIKSVAVEIAWKNAYQLLKPEAGVHRLVRLSPFNANNLRQTSFALVEVVPEIKETEVAFDEKDLKIDTFRASGAGGQHVNTTDSAVRITHLPTGLVATCQSERSQLQNREKAKKILLGRLYLKQEAEHKAKEMAAKGEHKSAEWGNQIRSYVLHPYKMVKDHRTSTKSNKVEAVLDGELHWIRGEEDFQ